MVDVQLKGVVAFLIAFSAGLLIGAQVLGSANLNGSLGMKGVVQTSTATDSEEHKPIADLLRPFIKDMEQARDTLRLETAEIRESEQALRGVATHLPEVARLAQKEVNQAASKLRMAETDLQGQVVKEAKAGVVAVADEFRKGVHDLTSEQKDLLSKLDSTKDLYDSTKTALDSTESALHDLKPLLDFVESTRQVDADNPVLKAVPDVGKELYLATSPPGYARLGSGVCANSHGQRVQYCQREGISFEACRRKCDSMTRCEAFNPDSHRGKCFIHFSGTWDEGGWECHQQGIDGPVYGHDGSEGGTCWRKTSNDASECEQRKQLLAAVDVPSDKLKRHLRPWSPDDHEWLKAFDQAAKHSNRYVINIGTGDGVRPHDPAAYFLTDTSSEGLACESDSSQKSAIQANYPSDSVTKIFEAVTPDNVLRTFNESGVPSEPLMLRISIDGYDADVVETVLNAKYRPRVIVVDHNAKFPPGFYFRVRHTAATQWACKSDHIYGNSAEVWAELFKSAAPEYVVLGIFFDQIVWAHRDLVPEAGSVALNCAYEVGYFSSEKRTASDVSSWLDDSISHQERLESMQKYLAKSNTRRALGDDYPIDLRLANTTGRSIRGSCYDSSCSDRITFRD